MFKKTLLAMAATSLFSGVAFNAFADQGHGTVTVMIHQRYDKNRERTEENGI